MRLTLLFIFLVTSVIADDESYEKYIDNLPEEEKREFLEKVARRILEDYHNNNKVPKNSSVNISDEALNTHTAYVQNILKEERIKTNKPMERTDNKDSSNNKDELSRKNSENQNFIDLTLRASKRDKRRNIENESNTNYAYVPVVPLYSTTINLINNYQNGFNKSTTAVTTPQYKSHLNDKRDNYTKNLKHSFIYDDSEEISERRSTIIYNVEPSLSDKNQYPSEEVVEDGTKDNYEDYSMINVTTPRTSEDSISRKSNKVTDSISTNYRNIETIDSEEKLLTSKTILQPEIIATTTDNATSKAYLEISTITQSITVQELSALDITKDNLELVKKIKKVSDIQNITQKNNLKNVSSTTSSITIDYDLNETTTYLPTESSISEEDSNVTEETKNNKSTNVISIKKIKKANSSAQENLHGGRKTYPQQNIVEIEKTFIKDLRTIGSSETSSNVNKSVYYVYEVSAERPPFVARRSNEDNDNEHYSPVYNYSPENGFYDPNNRYGPNEDDVYIDDNQDSLSQLRMFVKNIKREKPKNTKSKFIPKQLDLYNILKHKNPYNILKPQLVVPTSNNYNPYDYIDLDYYFGRNDNTMRKRKLSENILPNTEESDHPYSNYKKGYVKDHIQAVRKLLFSNKMFGYIPSIHEKRQKNAIRSKVVHNNFHNYHDNNKDDIAMDYYFGRQHSEEELDTKLHKFQLLKPITPMPFTRVQKQSKILQSKEIDIIEASCNVLRDFIKTDSEVLVNYDWLRTAVDVQSALKKLNDLTEALMSGEYLHPYDLELLKYVIYLYKSSQASRDSLSFTALQSTLNELRKNIKQKSLVPKIMTKKKGFKSAVKMWMDFATFLRSLTKSKKEVLFEFQNFLADVQINLYDLHEGIKNVAKVTTYKSQHWHTDLKNLYFQNADRRKLLTILLHLSASRLFGLIEDTKDVLEDSFSSFVQNNKEDVDTARNEFIFVLKLLDYL